MSFNSYLFIFLFLPLAWAGYFGLHRLGARMAPVAKLYLIGMSLWFYGYFHPWYLLLLMSSIGVNYLLYRGLRTIQENRMRHLLLLAGLAFNIGLIFYFKYFAFFASNLSRLLGTDWTLREVLLPLGISFFTFQQISFLIDAWRNETGDYKLTDYALFVSFFPQLVAGPIVLHTEMIPQLQDPQCAKPDPGMMVRGIQLFTLGLAKKLLLADVLGPAVAWGYTWSMELSALEAALVILSYTFQIYFDFSGYSDMAIGLGLLFHLELPANFRSPYRALSITDFWRRWHLTLTRFLTHYIYIPLGGNRRGRLRTYGNILVVFLVSGFWHGANWTFILWGLLHGLCQCLERACGKLSERLGPQLLSILLPLRWAVTFGLVNLGWALFRADSVGQWGELLTRFTTGDRTVRTELLEFYRLPKIRYMLRFLPLPEGEQTELIASALLLMAICLCLCLLPRNNAERELKTNHLSLAVTAALFLVCIISLGQVSVFLYFNF